MSSEEKIGYHEALTLLVVMVSAKIFLSFPRNMALLGDAAGWIIVLLSGIYSLIGYFFISALLRRYPGRNIIQISEQLTGEIIGKILGAGVFLFFLALTALYLRQFVESFILAILPRTPISVLTFLFLILLIYAAILGIETLSRVAWLLGPYLLTALIIILIFSLPQASVGFLTPVLGPGPVPILKFSLFHVSIFAEILLLGLIAPLIRDREKINRIGLISLITAIAINTGITALVTAVFNYAATKTLIFPILQLTRLISYGEFIQRVESVFVFLWFFWAGIQLGGLFYGTVISFAQTFDLKNYRPLVFPIAVITFTLSLVPASMTEAVELTDHSLINKYYSVVAFGMPFLLWLVAVVKKYLGGANV